MPRVAPTRAAGLLALALVVLLAPAPAAAATRTPAEVVRYTRLDACDQPFDHPPVDAETLHSEAFEWTRSAPLQNWQYAAVALADSGMRDNEWYDEQLEATCVRVSYSSAVRMPAVLRKYTSLGNFRTKIVKTTCVQADSVVLNDIRIFEIPFIHRVHITSKMRFADGAAESTVRAEYVLPWYLRFLESTAEAVVKQSYNDEIRATVHQLCVAPAAALPPTPPPVVVAPLLPPSVYFSR
jgi:hypothetical protein